MMKDQLLAAIRPYGQEHLLAFWDELNETERARLKSQIEQIDLRLVSSLFRGHEETPDWAELAERAEPPLTVDAGNDAEEVARRGESALRAGRVGMILVAGGQGTRLGFDHPKGMLPVGPLSNRTLFQLLIDRLRAVAHRYETRIPLYVMTSPATHEETAAFLAEHGNFGLDDADLTIFCQGVMPALDSETGKILRESRSNLLLSPDGHGGMLAAFERSGCLAETRRRNIDLIFYGQVDNPLLQVCDPRLLGSHILAESEMTTQVVRKQHPAEKLGNVVSIGGRTQIIEYSDLPTENAERRNADGSLRLWAGNVAVHVFERTFLERMVEQSDKLPFHRALKKSAFIDDTGNKVEPDAPNSVKFEKFIFDLLPAATKAAVVEVQCEDAFAPIKNSPPAEADTLATAQRALVARDRRLLRAGGVRVPDDIAVEVNPLWALSAEEVAERVDPGLVVREATYFTNNG